MAKMRKMAQINLMKMQGPNRLLYTSPALRDLINAIYPPRDWIAADPRQEFVSTPYMLMCNRTMRTKLKLKTKIIARQTR